MNVPVYVKSLSISHERAKINLIYWS